MCPCNASLLDTCVVKILRDRKGTAVRFYNLISNVSESISMSYTAIMMNSLLYIIVLFVPEIISTIVFFVNWLFVSRLMNENA